MLIGLMFLKNPLVYVQFHPVTYMIKLNIEMSMAALITKLARQSVEPNIHESLVTNSTTTGVGGTQTNQSTATASRAERGRGNSHPMQFLKRDQADETGPDQRGTIQTTTDIFVHREDAASKSEKTSRSNRASLRNAGGNKGSGWDDDLAPLRDESPA
jgi:hypothetical protein